MCLRRTYLIFHVPDEHIEQPDPRHRGRWYVVVAGLKVGIWKSYIAITPHVVGVPFALHQSFKSWTEANAHYNSLKAEGAVRVLQP